MDDQNWMEKLGVVKQLSDIQLEQVKQNAKIDQVLEMARNHNETLYGHDSEPGVDKTVDRLNEKEKIRGLWYGATVLVVVERIWSWVAHGGH